MKDHAGRSAFGSQIAAALRLCVWAILPAAGGCGSTTPETSQAHLLDVKEPIKSPGGTAMSFTILSTAFKTGEPIPKKHTEDGDDVSPALSWTSLPQGTKELALICDDPDAPTPEPWVHWVLYGIPATVTSLSEGIPQSERPPSPTGAIQGKNSWKSGNVGYRGPAPPKGHGLHHYHFRLYALDDELHLQPGLTKTQLLKALDGHLLSETEIVGLYQR